MDEKNRWLLCFWWGYLRSHSIEMKIPCVCLVCKWLFLPCWVGMFLIQMPIWWEYVWTKFLYGGWAWLWFVGTFKSGTSILLYPSDYWRRPGKQASVARVYDFLVTWPTQQTVEFLVKMLVGEVSWNLLHRKWIMKIWSFVGWDVKWVASQKRKL